MRKNWKDEGFTLVEVLVVVGVLAVVLPMGSSGLYQALSVRGSWQDASLATRELRSAGSWFAGDAMNATATSLVDGAPQADGVTLGWVDGAGDPHLVTYQVIGGDMVRNLDGVPMAVARQIVSVGFSLSGKTLTLQISTHGAYGTVQGAMLNTYLRMLP